MNQGRKGKQICIICEKEKQDGYFLLHTFICIHCEQQMVRTEPDDPLYKFYVNQLKKIEQNVLQNMKP